MEFVKFVRWNLYVQEFTRTGVYTHPSSPTTKTDNVLIDVQQEEYSDGDDVRAA